MVNFNPPTISPKLQQHIKDFVSTGIHGKFEDELGDAFEAYCKDIFSSIDLIDYLKSNSPMPSGYSHFDSQIVHELIQLCGIPLLQITDIQATTNIQPLPSGGSPKTDVLVTIDTDSTTHKIPISVKQTTRSRVSIAEFTVDQIVEGVGITNPNVIKLMKKHQKDGSAKNFKQQEKDMLKEGLSQYKESFVRWVFTGSSISTNNTQCPDYLIKFNVQPHNILNVQPHNILNVQPHNIPNISLTSVDITKMDNYIKEIIQRRAGFGTGLSWTYATGSKGEKIQFKG